MPTPAHQLPGGPTDLNRRVATLERELRELRAARRARHTSLDVDGSLRLVDAQGNVLTEMTSSFDADRRAAVAAYEERGDRRFYAALAAGDLAFGIDGMRRQDEGASPSPTSATGWSSTCPPAAARAPPAASWSCTPAPRPGPGTASLTSSPTGSPWAGCSPPAASRWGPRPSRRAGRTSPRAFS
ncbi:hypothetical protein ACFQ60_22325 [Streptomyces zhihengii]